MALPCSYTGFLPNSAMSLPATGFKSFSIQTKCQMMSGQDAVLPGVVQAENVSTWVKNLSKSGGCVISTKILAISEF